MLFLTAALLLQGCIVRSLHPFFSEETVVFKPELLNTWIDADGDLWEIERQNRGNQDGYKMRYTTDGHTSEFLVHLFELGDEYYVDFFPIGYEGDGDFEFVNAHIVMTHSIARVEMLTENEIRIKWFNASWLGDLFKQNRIRIEHEIVDPEEGLEAVLLTAPTAELQKFIIKYGDEDATYDDEHTRRLVLKRPA